MAFDVKSLTEREIEQLRLRLGLPPGGNQKDLIVKQSKNERDHAYESAASVVEGVVGSDLQALEKEDETTEERLDEFECLLALLIFWLLEAGIELPERLVQEIEKLDKKELCGH